MGVSIWKIKIFMKKGFSNEKVKINKICGYLVVSSSGKVPFLRSEPTGFPKE